MNIRESELPGVGKKFEVFTKNKDKMVIIIHDNGRRELYYFEQDNYEDYVASAAFDDTEARQIAAIIGGMTYKPKALENIEIAFDGLVIEWFKVEQGAQAANQSIGQLNVRQSFDVNIIAIVKKNHQIIHTPGPENIIEEGDTLIVSGERTQVKNMVKELLAGRGS
ncbi:potassium/proton antiporter regulatory subunit (CPA2 family) [Anoxybacillus vitaminiphilus]|uniref:Potassium/proton antiporter regulatory subunit (CPA2 family) n=1 Tax=Paranoxybacillus vitaminiphilus TaxID=581036 RepID=A0A327YQY2_9BACL|nr:cation:proton antiporter regulatory subunit [Anoxybacillus vitaminiphilus]RAK20529.1 potassium/proton antiporter regulatory subunit (CPA2 family) [Anoxybacillus vitaminiphilus]